VAIIFVLALLYRGIAIRWQNRSAT
jgi:hypothetical protein